MTKLPSFLEAQMYNLSGLQSIEPVPFAGPSVEELLLWRHSSASPAPFAAICSSPADSCPGYRVLPNAGIRVCSSPEPRAQEKQRPMFDYQARLRHDVGSRNRLARPGLSLPDLRMANAMRTQTAPTEPGSPTRGASVCQYSSRHISDEESQNAPRKLVP